MPKMVVVDDLSISITEKFDLVKVIENVNMLLKITLYTLLKNKHFDGAGLVDIAWLKNGLKN
jgi:hypothetical protein